MEFTASSLLSRMPADLHSAGEQYSTLCLTTLGYTVAWSAHLAAAFWAARLQSHPANVGRFRASTGWYCVVMENTFSGSSDRSHHGVVTTTTMYVGSSVACSAMSKSRKRRKGYWMMCMPNSSPCTKHWGRGTYTGLGTVHLPQRCPRLGRWIVQPRQRWCKLQAVMCWPCRRIQSTGPAKRCYIAPIPLPHQTPL